MLRPARSPIIAPAKERRRPKDFCCFKKLPRVFEKNSVPTGERAHRDAVFLNRRFIVRSSFMCDNVYITYKGGHQNVKVQNGQSMEQGFREP